MMNVLNNNTERLEKFKSITTEVYALTLGLGAFSLSTIPRTSMMDVAEAVFAFAIAFFYIAIIWITHSRFFEDYPLYDSSFIAVNFVILFLVAISPFLMQSVFMSPEFQEPMSVLFALDMMGTYALLGFLHQRYIWQNKDRLEAQKTRQVKMDRNTQYVISAWFLISAVIPIQYRLVFWMLLAVIPPLYRHRIGPIHVK